MGALSIVRFRTAIKEPEELAYLFLTIAVGLGFGANQRLITIVGFGILAGVILVRSRMAEPSEQPNLHVTVSAKPATLSGSSGRVNVEIAIDASFAHLPAVTHTSATISGTIVYQAGSLDEDELAGEVYTTIADLVVAHLDSVRPENAAPAQNSSAPCRSSYCKRRRNGES